MSKYRLRIAATVLVGIFSLSFSQAPAYGTQTIRREQTREEIQRGRPETTPSLKENEGRRRRLNDPTLPEKPPSRDDSTVGPVKLHVDDSTVGPVKLHMDDSTVGPVKLHPPDYFEGDKILGARAVHFLRPLTRDMREIEVYVEVTGDTNSWYFQTNFVRPGHEDPATIDSPTFKKSERSLKTVLRDLTDIHDSTELDDLLAKTRFKFDESAFDKDGVLGINTDGIEKALLVSHKSNLPELEISTLFTEASPLPRWIARIRGCCLFSWVPPRGGSELKRLEEIRFRKARFALISLVKDTSTEHFLASSKLNIVANGLNRFKGDPKSFLKKLFARNPRKTIVLLSHVEDGRYVIREPGGEKSFEIAINDVESLAKEAEVNVIHIGCNTAKQVERENGITGTLNALNTIDAVRAIQTAVESAPPNLAELLERIASTKLRMLIHDDMSPPVNSSEDNSSSWGLYTRKTLNSVAIRVATIIVTIGCRVSRC